MGSIIAAILAIAKAIPVIDTWIEQLSAAYVASRLATMKKENSDAIRKALVDHDQRDLEKAIGSPNAGQKSGDSGAVITDKPPPNVLPHT